MGSSDDGRQVLELRIKVLDLGGGISDFGEKCCHLAGELGAEGQHAGDAGEDGERFGHGWRVVFT